MRDRERDEAETRSPGRLEALGFIAAILALMAAMVTAVVVLQTAVAGSPPLLA